MADRIYEGVSIRPLLPGEMIEFGDLVTLTVNPFRAGRVAHGRKVLPSEAARKKFWRRTDG